MKSREILNLSLFVIIGKDGYNFFCEYILIIYVDEFNLIFL